MFFFAGLLLLLRGPADASALHGRVTDREGAPLPFANVYFEGTTHGTTTNADGYYRLEAVPGTYRVAFRFLGFRTAVHEITLGRDDLEFNVALEPEQYRLGEVVVTAGEDPAYAIMRHAVDNRKRYRDQVEGYACDVYIKGLQRMLKWPEKIMGQDIRMEQFLDSATHIIYLSESVSRFHFHKPDRIYEEMISSKVSGDNKAFSWNQASDMRFDFYDNLIQTGISPRGVVSPVAGNALFYYRYRWEGSYVEGGITVNRITVIPRRRNDPVFRGTIFIQDSTWRIHGADLLLTRDAGIQFVDSLVIQQVFLPVEGCDTVWLPATSRFMFHFGVLGFEGNGHYTGVFSNYRLDAGLPEDIPRGEVMKVREDANKKDPAYWNDARPVPLTDEERGNYLRRDSTQAVRESKAYLDSVDRVNNKVNAGKILLFGYTYNQEFRKRSFSVSALTENVQFNTVEGLNFGLTAGYTRHFKDDRRNRWSATGTVRYGVANRSVQGSGKIEYRYDDRHLAGAWLEGGRRTVQYNEDEPISPVVNTLYTLMSEQNYAKLLDKRYAEAGQRRELANGITLETRVGWTERVALQNHTDYSFRDVNFRTFSSNNPLDPADDTPAFVRHRVLDYSAGLVIRIRQQYMLRPYRKVVLGSDYPVLRLNYRGAGDILGTDVRKNLFEGGITHTLGLGLAGDLEFEGWYGRFVGEQRLPFADFKHFPGNLTLFSGSSLRRYDVLDYYAYSTADQYAEVHAEYSMNGFLFNKIPGLRKLRLTEIAGFHFLHVPGLPDHYEFSAGVSKLGLLRVDAVWSFARGGSPEVALRIGVAGLQ